jgi:hypothetical protein
MGRIRKIEQKRVSSIQVSSETRERLRALALTPQETYENILLRLMNVKLPNSRVVEYVIESDVSLCKIKCMVEWKDEPVIRFDRDGVWKFRFPDSCSGFDDSDWCVFRDLVLGSDNLLNNLRILDVDERIVFGDLVLSRVS